MASDAEVEAYKARQRVQLLETHLRRVLEAAYEMRDMRHGWAFDTTDFDQAASDAEGVLRK